MRPAPPARIHKVLAQELGATPREDPLVAERADGPRLDVRRFAQHPEAARRAPRERDVSRLDGAVIAHRASAPRQGGSDVEHVATRRALPPAEVEALEAGEFRVDRVEL